MAAGEVKARSEGGGRDRPGLSLSGAAALVLGKAMRISKADGRDRKRGTIVYDDDGILGGSVVKMLQRDGHEVTVTPSEEEARGLACSGRFDLVIVDLSAAS
jgi:hypothetical protein